jgi:hypothetical protein
MLTDSGCGHPRVLLQRINGFEHTVVGLAVIALERPSTVRSGATARSESIQGPEVRESAHIGRAAQRHTCAATSTSWTWGGSLSGPTWRRRSPTLCVRRRVHPSTSSTCTFRPVVGLWLCADSVVY